MSIIYTGESISAMYGGSVHVSGHEDGMILCLDGKSVSVMAHLSAEGARALAQQLDRAADAIECAQQQVAA